MIFEYRLGLALGKSRTEIRNLPNTEYETWKLFYVLEPFGWSAHHAMLYNMNRDPKSKGKNEDDLLKERAIAIIKELQTAHDLSNMSVEEKRNFMLKRVKKDFGIS